MYRHIIIPYDSLVVMDLDDTLISFPEIHATWWKDTKENYKLTVDDENADILTFQEWVAFMSSHIPELDKDAYIDLLEKVNKTDSTLIIVTARKSYLEDITRTQLDQCGIDAEIYFSHEKGKLINSIRKKYKHIHLVFADDNINNVNDVKLHNPDASVYCIAR